MTAAQPIPRLEEGGGMGARAAGISLFLLAIGVYGLYFLHLAADPKIDDWAKFTDEGWYANAAVRHLLWGHWFLPGDFNPAVALPVWPLLLAGVFHFTGVSLVAARALATAAFGLTLVFMYRLMGGRGWGWPASAAIALAASSPFLYSFDRIAILEPLMLCLTLAGMLLAEVLAGGGGWKQMAEAGLLGWLLLAAVLTKTTAIFMFPAVFYLLWWPLRSRPRRFLGLAGVAGGCLFLGDAAYYLLVRVRGYGADFRYLFVANQWGHPANWKIWVLAGWFSLKSMLWPDEIFALLTLIVVVLSLFRPLRRLWWEPIYSASVLLILGTLFFVFWHNNQQPRYFLVVAVAYYMVVMLGARAMLRWKPKAGWMALGIVVCAGAYNLVHTVGEVLHPEYTWIDAARRLAAYVDSHPGGNRVLLSISGDDISLMTGLRSICDDYGTADLPERIAQYRPGWFAGWDGVDAKTLKAIHGQDRLVEAGSFPAMNDPKRKALILYRLLPQPGADRGVQVAP